MRLAKPINSFIEITLQSSFLTTVHSQQKFIVLLLFVLVYYIVHLPFLGSNELNPDAVNWHQRSEQFVAAFKTQDFAKTYQHYHPGVTLMWIVGPSVELVKQFTKTGDVYTSLNYEYFHFAAKFTLLFVNMVLTIFLIYFLAKIIGFWKGLAVVTVLNLEPFILGNSRILHMDILFTNLVAVSLASAFFAFKSQKLLVYVASAVFTALSILTRSIAIGLILYNFVFLLYTGIISKSKKMISFSFIFMFGLLVTCFVLFPALWVKPVKTIDKIFSKSYQIGVEYGHNQIFLGEYTENPGAIFYIYVVLLKASPFLLVGMLLTAVFGLLELRKTNLRQLFIYTITCKNTLSFVLFLAIFYTGYFLVMNTSNKKLDRYMLPIYFLFSFISVWGYYYLIKAFNKKYVKLAIAVLFCVFVLYPIYKFAPYEFLYYSPIFKNSVVANNVITQKNFGMGVFHFRNFVVERYGCYKGVPNYPKNFKVVLYNDKYKCPVVPGFKNIGISDSKAMVQVYGNSNTTDFRYNSPSMYDIFVLAMGEDIPKEVRDKNINFVKDASIFINDIELWRVYVKQD